MKDAVSNPLRIIPQKEGKIKYVGKDASVVLNSDGKVVTAWANSTAGRRIK